MKNIRRLFLDDYRVPLDCVSYMHRHIGARNPDYLESWTIVRNFESFCMNIEKSGVPDLISFDHDLADEHYADQSIWDNKEAYENLSENFKEKTGLDCAKWLVEYCIENNCKIPDYYVHSMNPVGAENIKNYLEHFKKHQRGN